MKRYTISSLILFLTGFPPQSQAQFLSEFPIQENIDHPYPSILIRILLVLIVLLVLKVAENKFNRTKQPKI